MKQMTMVIKIPILHGSIATATVGFKWKADDINFVDVVDCRLRL